MIMVIYLSINETLYNIYIYNVPDLKCEQDAKYTYSIDIVTITISL